MEIGKRRATAPKKKSQRAMKPFRAPRRRNVIPGLLRTRGEEKKVLLTSQGTSGSAYLALNSTGTIQALNLIQVGSSMFNRIGRRIEMISVRLSASLEALAVTRLSNQDPARIIIVYDRQTNGAYPAITDVLQDTDQLANNTTTQFSGINMNNRERFVVLMDHRFYLPQINNTAGVLSGAYPTDSVWTKHYLTEFRKLGKLTTHYKADSNPAVIGDISTGGLFIISLAGNAAGTENFRMPWNVRLKYVDV